MCVPRHNHLGGALCLSWGPKWDGSSTTGSMVGSGSPGIRSVSLPSGCLLPAENPACSVADFFHSHSGVAMVTGLSHPRLIESSFGGSTKKNEQVEQYSPQMLPEIDIVCFHSSASPSHGHTPRQPHSLAADCSPLDWLQSGAVLRRKAP